MPTAGRLFGAVTLAALGWVTAMLVIPLLPEGTPAQMLSPTAATIGLLMGWIVVGGRAGRGWMSGIGGGLTGVAAAVFWVLLLQSGSRMLGESLRRRYDGPVEAIVAVFQYMVDFGVYLLNPTVLAMLVGGGVVVGLIAEWAGQRFR